MYTVFLSIVIGIIVGGCLYGKSFWEKRINVLSLIAVIMLVGLVTANLIVRPSLSLTDRVTKVKELKPMWISTKCFYAYMPILEQNGKDNVKYDSNIVLTQVVLDSTFDITDRKAENLVARGIVRDTVKTDSGYFVKESYREETPFYGIVTGKSTKYFYFVQHDPGDDDLDKDYWTMDETLKFVAIPENDSVSKPRIEFVDISYEENFDWAISEMLVKYSGRYKIVYLPQKEYEVLPESFKQTGEFPGREKYLNQQIANR